MVTRHAHCQVVCLATRAGERQAIQAAIEFTQQPLRVVQDRLVQISGVGVQQPGLLAHCLDVAWVGMPDAGDVVVAVEKAFAIGVEQPHALTANEMQRLLVE